jgi:transposase
MLSVARIDCIKEQREVEGLSISQIAKSHKISWATAKKYADSPPPVADSARQRRKRRVMLDTHIEIIQAWLEEDLLIHRKQRRTATAIYDQLKAETDYQGSDRTVRYYVKEFKKDIYAKHKQDRQYARLEHLPGTAQVDFGDFYASETQADGEIARVKRNLLVLAFPYSNAFYARALPAANLECLLYGLSSIFEEMGGAPPSLVFDNLKPVVTRVLKEHGRKLNDVFTRFKMHYRFQAIFCNPGKGNEKGNVEVDVGYVRRNALPSTPPGDDLDVLNDKLSQFSQIDRNRPHYSKGQLISNLHQEDRKRLLKLPVQEFEPVTTTLVSVRNKYGEIKVGDHLYTIPGGSPRQELLVKVWWDRIEVFDNHGQRRITTTPRKYVAKAHNINWAVELSVFRNKPRAIEHGKNLRLLPQILRNYLLPSDLPERKVRVRSLIELFEKYDFPIVVRAVESGLESGRTDCASLVNIADYLVGMDKVQAPIPEQYTPRDIAEWTPDLNKYSQLQGGVLGE